jgi:hypothetical protein
MNTNRRKRGRPKGTGSPVAKVPLHIEIPIDLKRAIEELAAANQRKITGEVIIALREHVARDVRPGQAPHPRP